MLYCRNPTCIKRRITSAFRSIHCETLRQFESFVEFGGNAVCSYETHHGDGSAATAWSEWSPGRVFQQNRPKAAPQDITSLSIRQFFLRF